MSPTDPYAPPEAELHSGTVISPHTLVYAGVAARFASLLADSFLISFLTYAPLWALHGSSILLKPNTLSGGPYWLWTGVMPAVLVVVLWNRYGATPGKMAIKAQVVDEKTLAPPSVGKCILRYLGYIVSGLPLGLGYFWAIFDSRNQTWHDKIAGTLVIVVPPSSYSK